MANNVKLKANVWMEIIPSIKNQSINSNNSVVNVKVKLSNPYGTYTYAGDGPGWKIKYVVKNGNTVLLDTGYITFNYSLGTTYPIDRDFTIAHNADGTPPSNSFSVYLVGEASQGLANTTGHTADTTISIPTIPRASDFTLSGNTIGSAMTMTITRASTNFTHKVWYRLPNQAWQTVTSSATTSASFTIPVASCVYLPDSTSGNLEIEMHTLNGTTLVGKTIKNISVNVPASVVPTVSATVTQSNTAIQTQFQTFIQDKSDAKFTITANGVYGSTIKSIVTTLLEKNYHGSSVTTDILNKSGNHQAIVRVTDSRGRIATFSTTISIVAYSPPKINSFSADRCNQDGSLNASGSYTKAIFNGQVAAANNKNTKSHLVRYRRKGTTAWTNLAQNSTVYTINTSAIASGTSLQYGYEFQYVVSDYFSSTSYTIVVPSGFFPITWSTDGSYKIGIGKVAEFNGIDFGEMPMVNGSSFFEGIKIPINSDLNNYRTPGLYYSPLNSEAETIANTPITQAFNLTVLRHTNGGVRQIFREYRKDIPTTYERNYYNGWGAWTRVITGFNLIEYMPDYIIASGNGYIKFRNGNLIQWGTYTGRLTKIGPFGNWFQYFVQNSPNFNIPFIEPPKVNSKVVTTGTLMEAAQNPPTNNHVGAAKVIHQANFSDPSTSMSVTVHWDAKGRWK